MVNPIPLTSPDGTIYTHACGVCHMPMTPHVPFGDLLHEPITPELLARTLAKFAAASREQADRCCRCWECREPLPAPMPMGERRCPACIPLARAREAEFAVNQEAFGKVQEQALSAALDKDTAETLLRYMEDISEDCWCAGWEMGLEFALWDLAHCPFTVPTPDGDKMLGADAARQPETRDKAIQRTYGMTKIPLPTLAVLLELAHKAGGWWTWVVADSGAAGPVFVPMDKWREKYAEDESRNASMRVGALNRPESPVKVAVPT